MYHNGSMEIRGQFDGNAELDEDPFPQTQSTQRKSPLGKPLHEKNQDGPGPDPGRKNENQDNHIQEQWNDHGEYGKWGDGCMDWRE